MARKEDLPPLSSEIHGEVLFDCGSNWRMRKARGKLIAPNMLGRGEIRFGFRIGEDVCLKIGHINKIQYLEVFERKGEKTFFLVDRFRARKSAMELLTWDSEEPLIVFAITKVARELAVYIDSRGASVSPVEQDMQFIHDNRDLRV